MNLIKELEAFAPEMTKWRHHLHQYPETSFEEFETAKFVIDKLKSFGFEPRTNMAKTGIVATLNAGSSDKTIMLRADMDALNMTESNTFDHASKIPGKMHGCGHDGHIVMLLGAAWYLSQNKNFDGTVHFIFQPAEEGGGGAKVMIDEGLFDQFDTTAIYGLHNMAGWEFGTFGTVSGPYLASTTEFKVTIYGKGGHGAFPDEASNPILPAGKIVSALNEYIGHGISQNDKLVLSVCKFHSGSATNVIPETAVIEGTIRSLSPEASKVMEKAFYRICNSTAAAYDSTCEIEYHTDYPILINSQQETENACKAMASVLGAENINQEANQIMGSEDFAFYLQNRPGNFGFIGNGVGNGCFMHNPGYDFNDKILPIGATYWVRLVEQELAKLSI